MLSRSHCPHTGVVNFFARAEPLLAVGSVIKAASRRSITGATIWARRA